MGYSAKILLDSISPTGKRLVTMEVTFPRIVLAEFNTHRMFSRNSASSRAIPVEKMLQKVQSDPFIPVYWGKNQKGMVAEQELTPDQHAEAEQTWLAARDEAVEKAMRLLELGIHKQITNRILEPWLWHTVIVTATEWSNFFALRAHKDAQPEIRVIAELMKNLYQTSEPTLVPDGHWHLPLCQDLDELVDVYSLEDIKKISAGRCARVSYLTHFGNRDPQADIDLCSGLVGNGHMSPLEHVATPGSDQFHGNFWGWVQYRREVPHESDFGART